MRVMRQKLKKMQKSEEKRKIPRSRKGTSIFPLFFSYFPLFFLYFSSSFSCSSLLHCTAKARAKFGRVIELKTTRKRGWNGKQGQNGVVLAYFLFFLELIYSSMSSLTCSRHFLLFLAFLYPPTRCCLCLYMPHLVTLSQKCICWCSNLFH